MDTLTIGRLAERAGVGVETIRFYERRGLIAEPARTAAGYRQYPAAEAGRLRFIRRAQELGFTLAEIAELLSLRVTAGSDCGPVRLRTEQKIETIDQKIRDLQRIRDALVELQNACVGNGPASACPILEAMAEDNERWARQRGRRKTADARSTQPLTCVQPGMLPSR